MKLKYCLSLLVLSLFFVSHTIYSQTYFNTTFSKYEGTSGLSYVAIFPDSGILCISNSLSFFENYNIPTFFSYNISRLDKHGKVEWNKVIETEIRLPKFNGGVILHDDIYLRAGNHFIKLDGQGNLLWAQKIPLNNFNYSRRPRRMVATRSGLIAGCENLSGDLNFYKMDTSGQMLVQLNAGRILSSSSNLGLSELSNGDFLIYGSTSNEDHLVVRTDSLGGVIWSRKFNWIQNGRSENSGSLAAIEGPTGHLYLAGVTTSLHSPVPTYYYYTQFFHLDPNGNLLGDTLARIQLNGEEVRNYISDIQVDPEKGLFMVAGGFMTSPQDSPFLAQFDTLGKGLWAIQPDSEERDFFHLTPHPEGWVAIAARGGGLQVIKGDATGRFPCLNLPLTISTTQGSLQEDTFSINFSPVQNQYSPAIINEIPFTHTVTDYCTKIGINIPPPEPEIEQAELYPNPSKGIFTLRVPDEIWSQIKDNEPAWTLWNALGVKVWQGEFLSQESLLIVHNLSSGVYFLEIKETDFRKKVILIDN